MSDREPVDIRPSSHRRAAPPRRRPLWWIVGAAVGTVVVLALAVVIGRYVGHSNEAPRTAVSAASPTPAATVAVPGPAPAGPPAADLDPLATEFTQFESTLHAEAGIAIGAVSSSSPPILLGDWTTGPAWSTSKIPLALAALRLDDSYTVTEPMRLAITESDNAAAESIWTTLGDPVDAASKVQDVLRQAGDQETIVPSQKKRQEFTIFGQTDWSLTNQVQFISSAACDAADSPILDLMGQIEPGQSWGIGTIVGSSNVTAARFKGGWGPSESGNYLVRQFGVLSTPSGMIAVAMAAEPDSGQFDDGTSDLTAMAEWLVDHLGAFPTGQCGP